MSDTTNKPKTDCQNCGGEAKWRWHDGKFSGGRYCDECIREKLDSEHSRKWPSYHDPITTEENVTLLDSGVAIIPAGARPLDSKFPTIRSQEAFDRYTDTDKED